MIWVKKKTLFFYRNFRKNINKNTGQNIHQWFNTCWLYTSNQLFCVNKELKDHWTHVSAAGFASDPDRLQVECDLFGEHIDYVEDVCKLISHVAVREAERVRAKHSQVSSIVFMKLSLQQGILGIQYHIYFARTSSSCFFNYWIWIFPG